MNGNDGAAAPDAGGGEAPPDDAGPAPMALEPTDKPAAAPMPDNGDAPMTLTPKPSPRPKTPAQ